MGANPYTKPHEIDYGPSTSGQQSSQTCEPPNKNLQAIPKTVEGGSPHKNMWSIRKKKFFARFQPIPENISISDKNSQTLKEGCSHENVQVVEEKSSYRNQNDQLVQEESSHENNQTTQEESFNEEVQVGEKSSDGNVKTVEEKSSHKNDQSVQEIPYEKVQTTSEESSQENDHDEEKGSFCENVQATKEKSSHSNGQPVHDSSHENDEMLQKKPSSLNIQNMEDGRPPPDDQVVEEQSCQCCTCFTDVLKKISVEPTMWLYMMAFMFTSVIEQAFFVYRACRVDYNLSDEICLNLSGYQDIKTEVQKTVSEFQQWYNITGHFVPIILALFFGNWSDRRGRKLPLIVGLTGKLTYSLMIVVNTLMENWNLNMVMYTAVIPMAVLGSDVIIFGSCFAYLSDICSVEERTLRITILDFVYLSTMPIGIALGSYVFTNVVNSSYTIMFLINSCMLMLAIVYSLVRLEWQTSSEQQPLTGVNFLKDFFDIKHVKETVQTMFAKRPNNGRMCLLLVMLSMCLYTFQRDERAMSYLYTQLVFNWNVADFSYFRTCQSSLFLLAILCVMPAMKYFNLKDTVITMIGAVSHASGRLLFITAKTGDVFYGGAVLAALGPIAAPALRSMASKLVLVKERGKVFAILSVFDNAVPLISSTLYSQIYNASINTMPNLIYWLTFTTQICVLLLAIIINFATQIVRTVTYCCRGNEPQSIER